MSGIGSAFGAGAVAVSLAAVWASVRTRWRRREPNGHGIELSVLSAVVTLALIGLAASLLAVFGAFDPIAIALCGLTLAAVLWPWGPRPAAARGRTPPRTRWLELAMLLVVCAGALGLRWPAADYPLAGRDQGTYTLRARTLLRTGGLDTRDDILASAADDADARSRPGPSDILGLHPRRPEAWRRGRYEGAYRPGWYLADRDRGRVVPQFLHLHPSLMAVAGTIVGADAMTYAVVVEAVLFIACLFCLARRMFGSVALATLAAALVAVSPLAIWVQRTALTETLTGLFFWAAVLAAARTRDHDPHDLDTAALLFGTLAWVRGNAWLAAPIIAAVLWLLPGRAPARRRPVALYLGLTVAGVLAHASTSFPYLVDELQKQLGPGLLPAPATLAVSAIGGVAAWWLLDRWQFHGRIDAPRLAWIRGNFGALLVGAAVAAVVVYLWLRAASDPKPFSRLDPAYPLFGAPLLVCAAAALPAVASSARLTRARDVWLAAAAATIVVTLGLYAQRNLPQAGLFYYGRYLVPELLPMVVLLAVATVRRVLGRRESRLRVALAAAAGLLVLGHTAAPLVLDPITRIKEFDGAQRLVDRLAAATPPDAIIIAGGEGWHHGHTFNQVGGALQFQHARRVLPYRSREAFYAVAYELLVARPEATGTPPPPVFLLLGEATHHYRRDEDTAPLAAIDDLLPPPFTAREVSLYELFTDRLTPVTDQVPTRVTRDQLRMGLLRIDVDATDERRIPLHAGAPLHGIEVTGDFERTSDGLCFEQGSTVALQMPSTLARGTHSVVLVATPGTARVNAKLKVRIDQTPRRMIATGIPARHTDTIGPLPVTSPPAKIKVRGFELRRNAPCPFGGLAELRVLGPDRAALQSARTEAVTLAPPRHLGHPVEPTLWVGGRGLSRYRPGIEPSPEIVARSIVVTGASAALFPPEPLPAQGRSALDIIVTITGSKVGPRARLVLSADGHDIATIDPPDDRGGTWQSEPIPWQPSAAVVRWEVRLEHAERGARVRVRDIGLFSRGPVIASRIVDE